MTYRPPCPTCGQPVDAVYPQPDGRVLACVTCTPGYEEYVDTLIDEMELGEPPERTEPDDY